MHLIWTKGSDALVDLHIQQWFKIRSQEVVRDACGDAFNAEYEQRSLELSTCDGKTWDTWSDRSEQPQSVNDPDTSSTPFVLLQLLRDFIWLFNWKMTHDVHWWDNNTVRLNQSDRVAGPKNLNKELKDTEGLWGAAELVDRPLTCIWSLDPQSLPGNKAKQPVYRRCTWCPVDASSHPSVTCTWCRRSCGRLLNSPHRWHRGALTCLLDTEKYS